MRIALLALVVAVGTTAALPAVRQAIPRGGFLVRRGGRFSTPEGAYFAWLMQHP